MHPSYTGLSSLNNDIAILTLSELAPSGTPGITGAERYGIYRGTNEVGQVTHFVGYGRTNPINPDGTVQFNCSNPVTGGTKRAGQNRFNDAAGTRLKFDFDRAGSGSAVSGEADTAPGDSGGPHFIGGLIAAVTSWGTDAQCRFGDVAHNTRVSRFASWIDSRLSGPYDLVLDMNRQVVGNNGSADSIRLTTSGSNLQLSVNGTLYHSDALSRIRSLTILGSSDADTITVGAQLGNVTVNGGIGRDSLVGPNLNNLWMVNLANAGELWTLADMGPSRNATFSSIETLIGGSVTDEFSIGPLGSVSYSIHGGFGIDLLNYSSLGSAVIVNLLNRSATRIGGAVAGRVASIEDVRGGSGHDTLVGSGTLSVPIVNRLWGGPGRDLLIGGYGADQLYGESGDDILIGGSVASTVNLGSVMSVWTGSSPFLTRVANLNGLLNSSTVFNDANAVDRLLAGPDSDWAWAYGPDQVYGAERVN
jgi:Ca2+-binding RTX toxin-like protein